MRARLNNCGKRFRAESRRDEPPSQPRIPIRIGVISDTHGFFDPLLPKVLAGAEAILHAGDVGSAEVLAQLQTIAPVHAVRGNVDPAELELPLSLDRRFAGTGIRMQHILHVSQRQVEAWAEQARISASEIRKRGEFLRIFEEGTRIVVFGHSHEPCLVTLGARMFLNPGSAGKKRFSLPRCYGILELAGKQVLGRIGSLEGYNRSPIKEKLLRWGESAP